MEYFFVKEKKMEYVLAAAVIIIALFFVFTNGFHDGCNVLATMISSHALSSRYALILGTVSEFFGALFIGKGVARTIGEGILNPALISIWVIFAALAGAILWNLITWWWALPSSSSQALVGGLLGAALIEIFVLGGKMWQVIHWYNIIIILIVLFISPLIGLFLGFILTKLVFFLSRGASPKVNKLFRRSQILSSIFLGLSHASNDAPKTMGIIVMSLMILKICPPSQNTFTIPFWVVAVCAVSISLGVSRGGWRIMRTLGAKLYKIRPVHGFGAQVAASLVIYLSSLTGFPVSTTQIVNSSVMGAGAADRPKAVRWDVIKGIVIGWLLTLPGAGLIAASIYLLIYWLR